MMSRIPVLMIAALVLFALAGSPVVAAAPSKTLDNLMAAYNGESNAQRQVPRVRQEGGPGGLRGRGGAVPRGGEGRGDPRHARTPRSSRSSAATPKAEIKLPEIKATADNLKAALEGETYERDKMYPEFIAEAKASGNKDALRAFNFAIAAEGEHAKFYAEAAANLQAWKAAKTFFVCPVCGKTVVAVGFEKCPVCFTPGEKFIKVL